MLSGFQMVGLPDFRSHSKSRPFATQPFFYPKIQTSPNFRSPLYTIFVLPTKNGTHLQRLDFCSPYLPEVLGLWRVSGSHRNLEFHGIPYKENKDQSKQALHRGAKLNFYACALNILKSAFLVFNTTVSMKKKLKNHVFKMIQPIFEQSLYTIFK